ncbi:helix-turn-helix transcriptional regulator [Sulfurospirillum diekertiae]
MIERFMDQIVENVKAERTKRGISQLALAQILGHKSPNYVAKIETRKHDVSYNLEHLYKIAYEFGIEVRDLIPQMKKATK